MTKTGQNFDLWSGDDTTLEVTVLDDTGTPVVLTGATLTWKVFTRLGSMLVVKTNGNGIAITDAEHGVCVITLTAADTDVLNGTYHHELQMVQNGITSTVMVGHVTVHEDRVA